MICENAMSIDRLSCYDQIVLWGAGKNCEKRYRRQFPVTLLVDKDDRKVGSCCNGMPVSGIRSIKRNQRTLFVISSDQYFDEIHDEIQSAFPQSDIVDMNLLLYIYGGQNPSFCLWGIDAIVNDLLLRAGLQYPDISYIEVGANHPFYGSATAAMYLKGSEGLLIEPNPDLIECIARMRPRDKVLNLGVSDKPGKMKYYRMDNSYRNTFDYRVVMDNVKKGYCVTDEMDVSVDTLDHIIRDYGFETGGAFLSIACMGNERKVLDGLSHRNYNFPIIALGCASEEVLKTELFSDYRLIASVPKHYILAAEWVYKKIHE